MTVLSVPQLIVLPVPTAGSATGAAHSPCHPAPQPTKHASSSLASKYCMCILLELRTLAQILFTVQQRGMAWDNGLGCRGPSTTAFPVEYLPSRERLQRCLGPAVAVPTGPDHPRTTLPPSAQKQRSALRLFLVSKVLCGVQRLPVSSGSSSMHACR